MWSDTASKWFVGILYMAILYILVRPGSNGAQFIKTLSNTLSDLVRGVTGQTWNPPTQNNPNGSWS